jgi:hypothetical protein
MKKDFTVISIKLSKEDLEEIRTKAKKFASGNVSAWMRFASRHFLGPTKTIPKATFSRRGAKRGVDNGDDFF